MVLVASPNPRVCRRWRQALQGRSAIHQVATQAALERSMAHLKPAILLLDLGLPMLGGVGGVPALQRLSPPTRIVLLTGTLDEKEGLSALKVGARGHCNTEIELAL